MTPRDLEFIILTKQMSTWKENLHQQKWSPLIWKTRKSRNQHQTHTTDTLSHSDQKTKTKWPSVENTSSKWMMYLHPDTTVLKELNQSQSQSLGRQSSKKILSKKVWQQVIIFQGDHPNWFKAKAWISKIKILHRKVIPKFNLNKMGLQK